MNTVFPIRYTLRLEPDLSCFRFSGRVNIELQGRQPVDTVVLNILELAVWNCMARVDDQDIPCTFYVNPEKEELRIDLPKRMADTLYLTVDYEGRINDKMAGFYRSKFEENGESLENYLPVMLEILPEYGQ